MKKLVISFSGGRTSGYMTKQILDNKASEYDLYADGGCSESCELYETE
jgi:hypothetical protein